MPQRFCRIVLVGLFLCAAPVFACLSPCVAPAFAAVYTSPSTCPHPTYSGCIKEIRNELPWNGGDVVAGGIFSGAVSRDVSYNLLRVTSSDIKDSGGSFADIYGGAAPGDTNAFRNRADLINNSQARNVYGGWSKDGSALSNEVRVDRSTVYGDVVGGWTESTVIGQSATGNTVRLSNGTSVKGDAIGGRASGTGVYASSNRVILESGAVVENNVYGGRSELGDTRDNTATVSGGTVDGEVFGGFSGDVGVASGNAAYITGGNVGGDVYGGRGPDGSQNNHAEISSAASTIDGDLVGGEGGDATGNTAVVSAGTVLGGGFYEGVVGGIGFNAAGNSALVSGGTVEKRVVGGIANDGAATGNSVFVSGGVVKGAGTGTAWVAVAGGWGGASSGAVSGNTVTLSGGTFVGAIIGGLTDNPDFTSTVRNNSVSLESGLGANALANNRVLGSLYTGAASGTTNMLDVGNTLNVNSFTGSVGEINNFQNFNFQVPDSMGPGGALLTITGATPTALTAATGVGFSFAPGGVTQYRNGDEITLISKTNNAGGFQNKTFSNVAKGISTLYDVTVYEDGTAMKARIGGKGENKQSETLTGPIIGGLTLVNLGADLVAGSALDQAWKTAKNCEEGGRWSFFSSFTYEDMEIDEKIDTKGWSYLAGMAWRDGSGCDYGFLGGAFFETGYADYDGGHSYKAGRAEFDGNVRYYGGGLLSRYRFENRLRLEASLRGGKVDSDYSASKYAGNQHPSYDLSTWYYGAHLGAGWDVNVADSFNLDFSGKYFWVRQKGKTVGIMDERVEFDDADSHRVKAGTRLTWTPHEHFDVFAGAYYEHELGGDIDAHNRTTGMAINTLDMGGASAAFELGVSILPLETRHMTLDMAVTGSTGTREGFGGHVSFGWNF